MNELTTQIRDLFASMTPGARITSGLLLTVALVSVGYLFQQQGARPDAYLFGGEPRSMSELNRMTAAMAEGGVTGYEIESNRLRVPYAQRDKAIAAIAAAGAMPADFSSFMDDALSQSNPLESRQQWELRTKAARENQLSHLITLMPWVEQANVMIDIEERRGFNAKNHASASVFVKPQSGEGLDKSRSRILKQMVASSLSSLSIENVQITSGGEFGSDSDVVFDDPYLAAREELQKSYRQKILRALAYIPGVRVEVSAVLENMKSKVVVDSTPGEPKVVSSAREEEEIVSSVSDGGGRPGAVANSASRRGGEELAAKENQSKTTRSNETSESTVGFSQSTEQYMGFEPKEVYASIFVPMDYVTDVWRQKNPDKTIEDLTNPELQTLISDKSIVIERGVQNILPRLTFGEDDFKQVEVQFYEPLERDPLAKPSLSENAIAWAGQYWSTLSMLGLAVFSLLMLRSVVKPGSSDNDADDQLAIELDMPEDDLDATPDDDASQERPKLRLRKGESLKDDLSEMVREDPDGAASILKAWINSAG